MRKLFAALVLLMLASCAAKVPATTSHFPGVHSIVTTFHDGSLIYGTCFATDPHTILTASHCVWKFDALGNVCLDDHPSLIRVDGWEDVTAVSVDRHDDAPAVLYVNVSMTATIPTLPPFRDGPGRSLSPFGFAVGTIDTANETFTTIRANIPDGWSGSPIIDDGSGAAIGVLWGAYNNTGIAVWYPIQ